MKTKSHTKDFDAVASFRKIKEKIAADVSGLSNEELMAYLKENSLKFQAKLKSIS
jgi:hypothetical protein